MGYAAALSALNDAVVTQLGDTTLTWGTLTAAGLLLTDYAENFDIITRQTRFIVQSSALPAIAQGASVTVGATAYTVRNVEPDGTGLIALGLERA